MDLDSMAVAEEGTRNALFTFSPEFAFDALGRKSTLPRRAFQPLT
jgi:hypothetical protein